MFMLRSFIGDIDRVCSISTSRDHHPKVKQQQCMYNYPTLTLTHHPALVQYLEGMYLGGVAEAKMCMASTCSVSWRARLAAGAYCTPALLPIAWAFRPPAALLLCCTKQDAPRCSKMLEDAAVLHMGVGSLLRRRNFMQGPLADTTQACTLLQAAGEGLQPWPESVLITPQTHQCHRLHSAPPNP
jgi:hypothetical protein